MKHLIVFTFALSLLACEDSFETQPDAGGPANDAAGIDTSGLDASALDSGGSNSGNRDAGDVDASTADDTGTSDGGSAGDSGTADSGASDGGSADAGAGDSGSTDMGETADSGNSTDMGSSADTGNNMTAGDCISGATGTHAVRFRWRGSQGSTAYVGYDVNQLPDTSRWKAGAYARSFGYTPQFGDTFLGIGGLIMDGTKFMDVELSTVGLSTIRNVTIAILGRSYNTTASGSYSWMTFDGSGAAPRGLVANSAPYQWYRADATSAFLPGNGGVLLRIEPGGPSNSLVVNSVELCFDAS